MYCYGWQCPFVRERKCVWCLYVLTPCQLNIKVLNILRLMFNCHFPAQGDRNKLNKWIEFKLRERGERFLANVLRGRDRKKS